MKDESSCPTAACKRQTPTTFLGDDATSADQIALAVVEILGKRVFTTDAESLGHDGRSPGDDCVRVVNSGTRALAEAQADDRNRRLTRRLFSARESMPVLQIDSRLRGIRNALRGIYDSLDFDFLLFVPAEPELDRLIHDGIFCHAENGRLVPFHESGLANSAERLARNSDLRDRVAQSLGAPAEQIISIHEAIVSNGPNAIVDLIRSTKRSKKTILIPDVTRNEHFEAVTRACQEFEGAGLLIAGSRTFLRSYLASFEARNDERQQMISLSAAIDRQKRGAPLAVVSSLEPVMNSQVEYARRALGPNLVTVSFDSSVILADHGGVRRETARAQEQVAQSLKAMRPVLLQTSRTAAFTDPTIQQEHLDALTEVVNAETIRKHVTALFVSGGQTAETFKRSLGVTAVEIKGAFQESIPWGIPPEGPLRNIPLVTKGGRMGRPDVLFEFLEQGHPLPRANVLPVVTPLTRSKEVDEEGIEKLIAHLVRLGTTDIFAVGNAGEFRFLANEQRLRAIELFARKARGRLRVFAGVTGDTADETRSNYEAAGRLGVYAAVVMPLYFLKNSDEILPFVESLKPNPPELPLVLYNNPERTGGQHIAFEAVETLAFPVVAIKDSSGDLDRLDRYARSMPVYEGQQRQFLEGYRHGARGAIGIIGHVSSLPNEFFAPTTTEARREEIAAQINDLSKRIKQGGAEVAAYKFALSLIGAMGDTVASNEAARELTADQREQIRANNAEWISRMIAQSPAAEDTRELSSRPTHR